MVHVDVDVDVPIDVDIAVIRNHPDDAGLIGAAHLAPAWIFRGHDSILAVDIGGTNIRAGVVELRLKKSAELAKACVWKSVIYRHADDDPSREEAVDELVRMLKSMIQQASKAKLGADHPHTLASMNGLALGYKAAGKLDFALPLLEETLRLKKAKLGADHPDTLSGVNNLALGYEDAGRLDEALRRALGEPASL